MLGEQFSSNLSGNSLKLSLYNAKEFKHAQLGPSDAMPRAIAAEARSYLFGFGEFSGETIGFAVT